MQMAKDNFAYDDDNHCYVCRQPANELETTNLLATAWMAELECIRYRGTDSDVLRRLAELDMRHVCDIPPPEQIVPTFRNHVVFTAVGSPESETPYQLASEFQQFLKLQNRGGHEFKTMDIRSRNNTIFLEFSWHSDIYHSISVTAVSSSPLRWRVEYLFTPGLAPLGAISVIWGWLKSDLERFTDIRWYTDADWRDSGIWQSTPW